MRAIMLGLKRERRRAPVPLFAGILCLFALALRLTPAQAGTDTSPPLLQVDAEFGLISNSSLIDQDIPKMLGMLGLDDTQPTAPVELYQKAALLEFLEREKAFQFSHQGDDLYPKFQAMLVFLKARRPHDDDPDLLKLLQHNGVSVSDMRGEFQKLFDVQITPAGVAQCFVTDGSFDAGTFPLKAPVSVDKIRVVPFSGTEGDLPAAVAKWIPGQVMKNLAALLPDDANEASYSDLAQCARSQLAEASADNALAIPGPHHLVRLEYQYDNATSVLIIRAGIKHTVSNVQLLTYRCDAADLTEAGKRKRELEQRLRRQLNFREMRPDQVKNETRRVVADYLGSHDHPQPTVTIHYEEDGDDLFGLVRLDIEEGPSFKKPGAFTGTLENNVPSGRLTGRASLSDQNLLGRGIRLEAAGSIGGEEGANLQLNAPAGIFRDRAWQADAGLAKITGIRSASGQYVEQRRSLELQFPLSEAHPKSGAPFYMKYYPTAFRYRLGQYDLTPDAGGPRQRYTVGVLGFSWRGDPDDFWTQPLVPRQFLGQQTRAPVWVRQSPFQLDIDAGSKLLGGDVSFVRAVFETRAHLVLSPRWLIALRGSAGWISNTTPTLEQPTLGGDSAPALLRAFNPEYFRGRQADSGTVEIRYFTTDKVALTLGADFGIAEGGAAPTHGVQDSLALGVYWLQVRELGGISLGAFWAAGSGNSRWSLALTGGF